MAAGAREAGGGASDDLGREVRSRIRVHAGSAFRDVPLDDGVAFGADLGFDSVRLIELLLDCEKALGVTFPDDLLGGGALTVGALVDHVRRARGSA